VGGSSGAWMSTSKVFALSPTVIFCLVAFFLNVRGLHVTKWLSGAGSLLLIGIFLTLVYLLATLWTNAKSLPEVAFSLAWPGFSLLTVNVFTKMSLFALSGLDQCSIFSEECRKPKNDVARLVFIAAPFIALMYIASTSTVLAYIPVAKVDLAAPVPQFMQAGFGSTAVGWAFAAGSVGVYCFALIATRSSWLEWWRGYL
jgi:amino acid transporter